MSLVGSIAIFDSLPPLWNFIKGPVSIICKLQENLLSLKNEWQEVKEMRNDLKRKVDIAEVQQMKRLDVVDGWLSRVAAMEAELDDLITESTQQVQSRCLGGCCPSNCWCSYKLGKKVSKKLQEVTTLKDRGASFSEVADRIPIPLADERPSSSTVGLESAFNKLWRCLLEENLGIIGLCGMGGVGKTTLLTQINNEFLKESHDFEVVIWVVVSQDRNEDRVQNEIGKKLGFSDDMWKSKSQDEKAIDILRVMKQKKFILLLDDVWERIDLLKLGVPLPQHENGSKMVFTTRSESVCGEMEAHKKIKVECLPKDKAWDLFRQKVGEETLNSHPKLLELAGIVAQECGGLPLALITIGRAMASKRTPEEWNHAISTLRRSAADFTGMGDKVFPLLKFSYDSLCSETLRLCFLYFSLFPEDYHISKHQVIGYWMGERILGEHEDIFEARNRGHDIISTLIHACLLESEGEHAIKMHDVIRDMALWITREFEEAKGKFLFQSRIYVVRNGEEKWGHLERLSLINCQIRELNVPITYSNLSTLMLRNCSLLKVCSEFFQFVLGLRVLDMSENWQLSELPLGISNLVSLEYLDLSFTGIRSLPVELKNLKNLKYLNLAYTGKLGIIPRQVLSSFHMLRALNMDRCGLSDKVKEGTVLSGGNEALVDELECLEHLQELSITLKSNSALQRFLKSQKLCDFTDLISLHCFTGSTSFNLPSLQNVKNLHGLWIADCIDLVDFSMDCWALELEGETTNNEGSILHSQISSTPNFENLNNVSISNCPGIKDLTWLIFAPNLQNLLISNCGQVQDIILHSKVVTSGREENVRLLSKLQWLQMIDLHQLRSINREALMFPSLKQMSVHGCPRLKRIPLVSNSFNREKITVHGEKDWWNDLEWEDEAVKFIFSFSEFSGI